VFGGKVRDELLAVELFSSLAEAQVLTEDWRIDYNFNQPHSALGMMAAKRQPDQPATLIGSGPMKGVRSPPASPHRYGMYYKNRPGWLSERMFRDLRAT
jgi:transposase InsO family protein